MTASALASFGIFERSSSSASGTASAGRPRARRQSAMMWFWSTRSGHAPIGLHLRQRLLPALLPVERQAEHLADRARAGRELLRLLPSASAAPVSPRSRSSTARERRERASRTSVGPRDALDLLGHLAGEVRRGRGLGAALAAGTRGEGLGHGAPSVRGRYENGPPEGGPFSTMFRQRPTLPPSHPGSTIGAGGLNFRVRDGTGCFPSAMATETVVLSDPIEDPPRRFRGCVPRAELGNSIASASKVKPSAY